MAIMQNLLQKLSPRPQSPLREQETRPEPARSAPHYLELEQLCAQRQLLKVTLTGHSRGYQSLILAVDSGRGLIWLDDLFPRQPDLSAGEELQISHHKNGNLISFKAPILAFGERFGAGGVALALPEEPPRYRPRRQWPRLELESSLAPSATLAINGRSPVQARVLNISAGGVRLALNGNWLGHFRHGELLPLCELPPLAGTRIRCRARVCAFNISHSPRRQTEISLAFIDLDPFIQRNLQHFIAARTSLNPTAQAA